MAFDDSRAFPIRNETANDEIIEIFLFSARLSTCPVSFLIGRNLALYTYITYTL